MPFLNNIIGSINQVILGQSFSGIPAAKIKMYGISSVMIEPSQDEEGKPITKRYPSIIDNDGEVTEIDIDEAYSIITYHKLEGITNTVDPKSGYARSVGNIPEAANMSLMLFAFRTKTRKEAWWFEAAIKDKLPEQLKITDNTGAQLQLSFIKIGNSSYDALTLLQREFAPDVSVNYPDLIAMELKYRIESTWKRGCFLSCGCEGTVTGQYIATETGRAIFTEN